MKQAALLVIRDPPAAISITIRVDNRASAKAQRLRACHAGKLEQRAVGMTPDQMTAFAVALLAGSELLSYLPGVKANGWVQLILAALQGIVAAQGDTSKKRRR